MVGRRLSWGGASRPFQKLKAVGHALPAFDAEILTNELSCLFEEDAVIGFAGTNLPSAVAAAPCAGLDLIIDHVPALLAARPQLPFARTSSIGAGKPQQEPPVQILDFSVGAR